MSDSFLYIQFIINQLLICLHIRREIQPRSTYTSSTDSLSFMYQLMLQFNLTVFQELAFSARFKLECQFHFCLLFCNFFSQINASIRGGLLLARIQLKNINQNNGAAK